ncbi:hypothetical protein [Paracoccus sp. ME4]|uniref:hypothetical protein n=1 Tax=Paracoccus sp. ME4 TaxID=3138066 RepID=UPI00398A5F85
MNRPLATSALALILGAGPALADVTPAEVWDSLRTSYEKAGYAIAIGAEEATDERIALSDVVLTVEGEAEAPDMVLTMPSVVLEAVGDGTVRSVVEQPMTIESTGTAPDGDAPMGFTMTLDMPGNETITSGTPEALTHDVTIPTLTMDGRALDERNEVPLTASMTNVTGRQTVNTAADGASNQTFEGRADSMEMRISASGPSLAAEETLDAAPETAPDAAPAEPTEGASDQTDRFEAVVTVADLTMQGDGTSPAGQVNFGSAPTEALEAGFGGNGRFGMGATTISFSASTLTADGTRNDTEGGVEAASGSLAVGMSAEGLSYEGSLTEMQTRLSGTDLPFPIAYGATENRFRLAMPVLAAEEEQPFALTYVLDGLTLDDAIWQALDPEAALPRDPASLTIDLEGQAVLSQGLMDPEAAQAAAPGPDGAAPMPMTPRSLAIKALSLDAVGATVDLSGALTFGEDPTQPVGTIEGTFGGVNGLLDKLVAMGVVPAEQLMGPRMMMAMFARPVEGAEDQLQTEIEFREGGSIFANGQQIQ